MTSTIELENKNIKLEIWDTAGQEMYRSMIKMYYRSVAVSLVVYDVHCHGTITALMPCFSKRGLNTEGART